MAKLDIKAFGLALGIVWGAAMFLLGLTTMWWNWGEGLQFIFGTLYIGYKPTFLGSIIGGVWGFIDAGIGGVVVAWLYNKLTR